MAALFKKKAKASDIADGLVRLAFDMDSLKRAVDHLKIESKNERELVKGNLFMLQLFSIDFATAMTLNKETPQKNAVLDHYYDKLESISQEMEGADGVTFFDDLKDYLVAYTNAVKTPHESGIQWTVGKEFAKLCNKADDLELIMFGGLQFSSCFEWVSKVLKKFRIKV